MNTASEHLISSYYQRTMESLEAWETKTRALPDGEKRNYRITRLRYFFMFGLGRPVPQADFSFWCGTSRDTIAAVESGKTKVTARLAERIYDLTGAELSWLNGKAPLESYDYDTLQARFPKTLPLTSKDMKLTYYTSESAADTYLRINAILFPLGRSWSRVHPGVPKWPAEIIKQLFAPHIQGPDDPDSCPQRWQAFAFAPDADHLLVAINEGMLDHCPVGSPARKVLDEVRAGKSHDGKLFAVDPQLMEKLSHSLLLTLSLEERGML